MKSPLLFLLAFVLGAALSRAAEAPPRLLKVIQNQFADAGDISFGRSLDWDDSQILVGGSDSARVYDRVSGAFVRALSSGVTGMGFGTAVALTPEHYIVSSTSMHTGSVHVFRRTDGVLLQTIPEPPGGPSESKFGGRLAVGGHRLFVFFHKYRAREADPHQGAVYVYDMRTWTMERIILSGEGVVFDGFGDSIAVDGNTLVVGANRKDEFTGTCYIYDVATGVRRAKFREPAPGQQRWFGSAVLVKGDRVFASSRAAICEYSASTGAFLGEYRPSPAAGTYDWFGSALAVTDGGQLFTWSSKGLFVFDTATRTQLMVIPNPLDDGTTPPDEGPLKARGNFIMSGASGGSNPGTRYGAILEYTVSPNLPVVSVPEQSTWESGQRMAVRFPLHPASTEPVRIDYETVGGSAREGIDYTRQAGTLVIPAGKTEGVIYVPITNDKAAEEKETFYLKITGITGANAAAVLTSLNIADDDNPVRTDFKPGYGPPVQPEGYFGSQMVADGNRAYISARNLDASKEDRGGIYVMNLSSRSVVGKIEPVGFATDAFLGTGLALDGNVLAVGATKSRENPAVPAIYFYNTDTLQELGKIFPPDANCAGFGNVLAMRGKHLLVGMPFEDLQGYGVGACLLYDRETMQLRSRLVPPVAIKGGEFGCALAIHGNRAAIGSDLQVFVYDLADIHLSYTISGGKGALAHAAMGFGEILAMNDRYLAVGNYYDDTVRANSGSVIIFNPVNGELIDTVRARTATGPNPSLGESVALDGNLLLVGSGGYQTDLHLFELPSGGQLAHFSLDAFGGFFGDQQVAFTDRHFVLSAIRLDGGENGLLYSSPRHGNSFDVWRAISAASLPGAPALGGGVAPDDLFFQYASGGSKSGTWPLAMESGGNGFSICCAIPDGLRSDASYVIQSSADGVTWRTFLDLRQMELMGIGCSWRDSERCFSFPVSVSPESPPRQFYRLQISEND